MSKTIRHTPIKKEFTKEELKPLPKRKIKRKGRKKENINDLIERILEDGSFG